MSFNVGEELIHFVILDFKSYSRTSKQSVKCVKQQDETGLVTVKLKNGLIKKVRPETLQIRFTN